MKKANKKVSLYPEKDIYQIVTDRVIAEMENGNLAWNKTWNGYGLAKNYETGEAYKGINMLMMNFFLNHEKPYYLTFLQTKKLGGTIKKGAKATEVIYYNVNFKDAQGAKISPQEAAILRQNEQKVVINKYVRYYNVFNVADIEGIDFQFDDVKLNDNEKLQMCEDLIQNYPDAPAYEFKDTNRAFYSPYRDVINMPPIEHHTTSEDYYSTFFHEIIHSTGHQKRLNRGDLMQSEGFGSKSYAREELTAELGSAFLCAIAQIAKTNILENSAAYLQGWLKVLKEDNRFIFEVAAEAQKAVDFVYRNANIVQLPICEEYAEAA